MGVEGRRLRKNPKGMAVEILFFFFFPFRAREGSLALLIQLDVITQFLWGLSVYWSAIILECSFFVPILHLFKNPKVCVLENMRVHHCIFLVHLELHSCSLFLMHVFTWTR